MRAPEHAIELPPRISALEIRDREDDYDLRVDERDERQRALRRAYQDHGSDVHRFALHLTRDSALASDVTQETFVRAIRRLDTLRVRERPLPWLLGIARNVVRELRHRARRDGAPFDESRSCMDAPRTSPLTPERVLLDRELAGVLDGALEALSTDRRAALVLRIDQGMSYAEVAEVMGWSLAKAKVEVHRARTSLREHVRRYQGGQP